MNLTMKLTLDGLIRALRTRAEILADDRAEDARKTKPNQATEDRDEQRRA